jgi:hypothetical protein
MRAEKEKVSNMLQNLTAEPLLLILATKDDLNNLNIGNKRR